MAKTALIARPVILESAARERLTALVVDDDTGSRLVLKLLLEREGFSVRIAADGESALAEFEARRPALVFLDVVLPGIDGYDLARELRNRSGPEFLSIVFLTALSDPDDLSRCLDAGGDDVMTKPYKPALLQARVRAAMRARAGHDLQRRQFLELNEFRRNLEEDLRVAQRILAKIVRPEELAADNIRHTLRPHGVVSGDFTLMCRRPNGAQLLLVGDASGHGLPAAVTAMLVADTFYAMGRKGLAIPEIVLEMNRKLRSMLPVGRYLATALVEFDADERRLAIWNAGLPDLLVASSGGALTRFPSRHVPLGVLDNDQVEVDVELVAAAPDSWVYLYTDGVTEARNARDELYGSQRFERCIVESLRRGCPAFDRIVLDLDAYAGDAPRSDDQCLIEIACRAPQRRDEVEPTTVARSLRSGRWSLALELEASALRHTDPVAVMTQAFADLHRGPDRQRFFLILTELYSNALEHGLLGLDSSLKHEPEGFMRYYEARTERLAALDKGTIRIEVEHVPAVDRDDVRLRLRHDGVGFEAPVAAEARAENLTASGRGMTLVRSLSDAVSYSDAGRCVDVACRW